MTRAASFGLINSPRMDYLKIIQAIAVTLYLTLTLSPVIYSPTTTAITKNKSTIIYLIFFPIRIRRHGHFSRITKQKIEAYYSAISVHISYPRTQPW